MIWSMTMSKNQELKNLFSCILLNLEQPQNHFQMASVSAVNNFNDFSNYTKNFTTN